MRKINALLFFVLFCIVSPLFSQDTIVLKTGSEIKAKIITVNDDNISYKKFDYQDGPTFIIEKSKVYKIKYADGTSDVFGDIYEVNEDGDDENIPDASEYGRNIFAHNPFGFIGGNFAFSYERIGSEGRFGIRIPVIIPVFENSSNAAGSGIDFKFYFPKEKKVSYYIGPSVPIYVNSYSRLTWGIMADNGVSFMPGKKFNISIDAAIGGGRNSISSQQGHFGAFFVPIYRLGVNFGIRF